MAAGALHRMPDDRRRALLRAAADEFARAGYESASLNRIIARVGLSKSSFYHVIDSKRDLFEVVVRELSAELAASLRVPQPEEFRDGAYWERVDAVVGGFATAAATAPALAALGRMFYLSDGPDDAVRAVFASVENWLDAVLRAGRESGAVRDDLPVDLQRRLLFAVLRTIDEWAVQHLDEPPSPEPMLGAVTAAIRRLLEP